MASRRTDSGRRPYGSIFNQRVRSFLALSLVAFILVTSFSLPALAQTQSSDFIIAPKTEMAPPGKVFTVYEGENGEVTCRDATLAERREMFRGRSGQTLRQINHLKSSVSDARESTQNAAGPGGLTIILLGTAQLDANPAAKAAFTAAAANWEAIIKTPMTVYVEVDYGTTHFGQPFSSPQVLASTFSPAVFTSYSAVRGNMVAQATNTGSSKSALYSLLPASVVPTDLGDDYVMSVNASIARAIGLIPADATQNDPRPSIAFNSAKVYDFNPNPSSGLLCPGNGIDCDKTDFDAVATHEIGHALGFTSNNGDNGEPPNMEVWDLFRFRPGVTSFNSNQRIMSRGGSQVFFDGGATELSSFDRRA